jgi:methionyl-tRNA synthetase
VSETSQPEVEIGIEDFAKVVLKTATVVAAENHPNADRLLKLTVRVGEEGERTICAGIKQWWQPEDLVGKTIVIVANLAPRMMRGVESRGMLLAVQDDASGVVPLTVLKPAGDGLRVS